RDRVLGGRAREAEQVGEAAPAPLAHAGNRRRRRASLLDPPVLESRVLAERADVDEIGALVRRIADRALTHQERALADRTSPSRWHPRHVHCWRIARHAVPATCAARGSPATVSYMCVLHLEARRV